MLPQTFSAGVMKVFGVTQLGMMPMGEVSLRLPKRSCSGKRIVAAHDGIEDGVWTTALTANAAHGK